MARPARMTQLEPVTRDSISDRVFAALHARVLSLDLPPGAKMSEAEVSRSMGVSRQPVRDAFYRLSTLGFLTVQPQRATTVSRISARDIRRARFIRTAIEVEIVHRACEGLDDDALAALEAILERQAQALEVTDRAAFHRLDDRFHEQICTATGLGFAWEAIRENKAHTDRVRYLSLAFGSARAYGEHRAILDAIAGRDAQAAEAAVRHHLSQIEGIVARLKAENHAWFAEEE